MQSSGKPNTTQSFRKFFKTQTFLNLDRIQEGVGNASCGPKTLEKYRIKPDTAYNYSLILEPLE